MWIEQQNKQNVQSYIQSINFQRSIEAFEHSSNVNVAVVRFWSLLHWMLYDRFAQIHFLSKWNVEVWVWIVFNVLLTVLVTNGELRPPIFYFWTSYLHISDDFRNAQLIEASNLSNHPEYIYAKLFHKHRIIIIFALYNRHLE